MQILLLRHYPLAEGPSMRTYAEQISTGLRSRGHSVHELTAPVCCGLLLHSRHPLAKWLGYVDQFLLFPPLLWLRARFLPAGSLCVLSDQALGPWFPWLAGRPHLVHCHDLLALQAAQGLQPFHQLSRSGRAYQHWIQRGFRRARCFLSVSSATRSALSQQLGRSPLLSAVLHNPLSPRFTAIDADAAAATVAQALPGLRAKPFLFHIGRNWYKNRLGVLAIWEQLRVLGAEHHLVLVGALDSEMLAWLRHSPHLCSTLHVLDHASDALVVALYNGASALLFPSHAEGFGWPILEALACGCPVLTTDRDPMTEVGGEAITTIPPAPGPPEPLSAWASAAALTLQALLHRSIAEQDRIRQLGFAQASRYSMSHWLDQLEHHYRQALALQAGV
jgi:glycosyltransferase involved in cell wall biosynthesis